MFNLRGLNFILKQIGQYAVSLNMAGRFTWTQLMRWEQDAIRKRVPLDIPGLIPRSELPNNRMLIKIATNFERNGEKTVLNQIWAIRAGFSFFFGFMLYQMIRPALVGWTNQVEHHSYNYDNMVYDKLSTHLVPYHTPLLTLP